MQNDTDLMIMHAVTYLSSVLAEQCRKLCKVLHYQVNVDSFELLDHYLLVPTRVSFQ